MKKFTDMIRKMAFVEIHPVASLLDKLEVARSHEMWERFNIEVGVFTNDINNKFDVVSLLNAAAGFDLLEGVYVTLEGDNNVFYENFISDLDVASRSFCSELKYFAVLNVGENTCDKNVFSQRRDVKLPATLVSFPALKGNIDKASWCGAIDAAERALVNKIEVAYAHLKSPVKSSLLHQIASLADIPTPNNNDKNITLKSLGVQNHKLPLIADFLESMCNVVLNEEQISLLTVHDILELATVVTKFPYESIKGLSTVFNYIGSDELLATSDIVFMPTLVRKGTERDDEFDETQAHLYIVPGIEGNYERLSVLCERLKLTAVVLQPGLDHPHETVRQTAERMTQFLLKKTRVTNNFYLLGYESGVTVALEIAAILEKNGLTGTVFCLGCAPDEIKETLENELSDFKTSEQLENGILRHICNLLVENNTINLENALKDTTSWEQKRDKCVRTMLGRVPHSTQYIRTLMECVRARIERVRRYSCPGHSLCSKIVLIRAANTQPLRHAELQRYTQQAVVIYQLSTPLAHIASDLRCAAIINEELDPAILEAYSTTNICDTYLINPDSFMTETRTQ